MHWIPALGSCFAGVLVGDFVVYFLGFFYGEKVLSLPLTRKFLTRAREAQIKGYFHRHGVKILILGRFAVGFRTAAYLTAGILRLPTLKLFLTDLFAASFSTLLMFGLGYAFATKVEEGFNEAKHYITPAVALGLARLAPPPLRQGPDAGRRAGRARRSWSTRTTPRSRPTTSTPGLPSRPGEPLAEPIPARSDRRALAGPPGRRPGDRPGVLALASPLAPPDRQP